MMSSTSTLVISGLPKNLGMISLPYHTYEIGQLFGVPRGCWFDFHHSCDQDARGDDDTISSMQKVLSELRGTNGKRLDLYGLVA